MGDKLFPNLKVPVIVAPMFLVSGTHLVIEACKAGVIGSMPSLNCRTAEDFETALISIQSSLQEWKKEHPDAVVAPYAVNMTIRMVGTDRFNADLAALERHRVPVVITSVGDPTPVVDVVHRYGGRVLHDVTTLRHARKAVETGVDGLILVCAGAGGHAGSASPFALVPQVRAFFDGAIILAGAISDGRSIRAAQVLGADYVYMGTRFIATTESKASEAYKTMLVEEGTQDVIYTPAFSGMAANYLKASIVQAGLDPENLPKPKGLWQPDLPEGIKAWKHIWSAGQGVGMIKDIPSTAALVERLHLEYTA